LGARTVVVAAGFFLLLGAQRTHAAPFHRSRAAHASGVSLRKRLHVNDLITEPGTVELDWGGLYSYTNGVFTLPSALKYTPAGDSLFRGRTEYSVAFDSVASAVNTGARSTQFSDRLTFAATSVVFDSEHFDIAIAPQVTVFLRNESGVRLGATAIARYDGGGNTIGATVGWTAATSTTTTNPAGVWDFGTGYGRRLAASGFLSRLTPHVNAVLEKSTGLERTLAVFGGIEYQITERVAIDASVQRLGLTGDSPDRQFILGLTVNLGKAR
jgi:hypothetical protein